MKRLLAYFLIMILAGCGGSVIDRTEKTTRFSGVAMTMAYKVIIGAALDDPASQHFEQLIADAFDQTNTHLNKWNPGSEVSQINRHEANTPITLSPLLLRLFNETDVIVKLTEGRFDPTIEPLQALWKEKIAKGSAPSTDELDALAPMIGWDKIKLDGNVLIKLHSGTQFDFGGIAKGLCIDLICESLEASGWKDYYVEWGGEIRAGGKHPEGRPWTIFIARLNDTAPEHAVATVELNDQAIATSGDYLQNWTIGDRHSRKTYFHIFATDTLHPLEIGKESVASASVLARNCAFADGLATAAMMFPSATEAEKWAASISERYPGTQLWIVTRQ